MNRAVLSLVSLAMLATLVSGCGAKSGKEASEKDKESLRAFFLVEWNNRFVECESWYYSRPDFATPTYLGMQTEPSAWTWEWKPASAATDNGNGVAVMATVFITTRNSTVYSKGSWFRPFRKESGYLVAADLDEVLPAQVTRELRNDRIETLCSGYTTCVGLDVIQYEDGSRKVVDSGKLWKLLKRPENCGEIPG